MTCVNREARMASYLVLHEWQCGCWSVLRCYHDSDAQNVLFTGDRQNARAYLAAHWED